MEPTLDPATALARLAGGVIVADGRVSAAELASAEVLDHLGLGPMRQRLLAELERTREGLLELEPAIVTVAQLSPRARAVVFEVLTELAAADGELNENEAALLDRLATRWDLEAPTRTRAKAEGAPAAARAVRVPVEVQEPAPPGSEPAAPRTASPRAGDGLSPEALQALAVLGLPPDASPAAVEEAFRALVHRYDPAHVIDLGPEFAILAIRRLSRIADAYLVWKRLGPSGEAG